MSRSATPADACACESCLRRSWLVARLAGHIELAWSARRGDAALLALDDAALIAALAGRQRETIVGAYERFDAVDARRRCEQRAVVPICRCDERYPAPLRDLGDAPAVLYLHGAGDRWRDALSSERVAIVGARRGTPYGLEQARALGRGLAAAGVVVVSGMALGIDAAAHAGALEAGGVTVAVLACGPEQPYPASKRLLHAQIARLGAVVAELPPGTPVRRWCFPARNRIIAALARVTVVVEASERSGSLITAGQAAALGREVGAVPGLVTAPLAAGTNALIADGAQLVRGARDVLELLFGASAVAVAPAVRDSRRDGLSPRDRALLDRVANGCGTLGELVVDGDGLDATLAGLAQLELRGLVRRGPGGRYAPTVQ